MTDTSTPVAPGTPPPVKAANGWKTAFIVLVAILATAMVTALVLYRFVFPGQFTPVVLDAQEQATLEHKLERIDTATRQRLPARGAEQSLAPEPYTEAGASREIAFTEKELNALLASNTDLAARLAIDLSDNLASAKLLVPVDPDAPLLGGKTIRIHAGMELAFREDRPVVILKGVSLWGVPMPNAWLGGMKNVDLVREFGNDRGFWKAFADGVELIEVREGRLHVILRE